METKALNINENSKENLKKGAALAGAAMAGAGVMVTADIIRGEEEIKTVEATDENPTEPVAVVEPQPTQSTEQTQQPHSNTLAATNTTSVSEPTPQGGAETSTADENSVINDVQTDTANNEQANDVSAEIDINDIPNVDPQLVAQNIVDDVVMVDETDIDMGNLDIAAVGTVETVDGEVLTAAQFVGDNGESLYMVDVSGNGVYDVVTDETGNILAEVPTTLTVSDSQSIVSANNDEYGYLAQNDSDNATDMDVDNPMDDVVDLG